MTQSENDLPPTAADAADESSPWQRDRDRWDKYWLDGENSEHWRAFEEFGVTKELFVVWIKTMRRPIREWQEMRWYPTTEEHAQELRLDERRKLARETALTALREFLRQHPELPTAAIRPLLHDTVSEYHIRYGMANLRGRAEAVQTEENLFIDEVLHLYRDGELPPATTAITEQRTEIQGAVERNRYG